MMLWGIAILFAIISGVLLAGKGGFLIAGYNTSNAKDKAKYDEKKLCRTMGVGMSVITVMLLVMAIMGDNISGEMSIAFMMIIVVDIIFMLIWTNTKCYATDENGNRIVTNNMTAGEDKSAKKMKLVVSIVLAVVFVIVGIVLMTGDIKTETSGSQIHINASYWKDCDIDYSDVTEITYSEHDQAGSRTNGFGSFKLNMGRFENNDYGRYTRYTYIATDPCVVIHTKNDGIYVINAKTAEETKKLYDSIANVVKSSNAIGVQP